MELSRLDPFRECKRYGFSLFQCPSFLFFLVGLITIFSILLSYIIGARYIQEYHIVALISISTALILILIGFALVHSFEDLLEDAKIKSQFIHIISHHIRSPLSNLSWLLDFLIASSPEKINPTQLNEYLQILKENSKRMENIIQMFSLVYKIESALLIWKKEPFSISEITKNVIDSFSKKIKEKKANLSFYFSNNLPKNEGDPFLIKKVIEILIENALSYIKEGGEIEIKIFQKGSHVCFEIKDNGVGIPQSEKKYIFRKFYRAKNILADQTQGLGMGLYLAKRIIKRSRGKIGFTSKEGLGSTFWFTLPILK